MSAIDILLVDDHQIVRDGIKSLLKEEKSIVFASEASSEEEVFQALLDNKIDLIIMDISMPGSSGIEISKKVMHKYPEMKILILSMFVNEEFILGAIECGARGYLPKNTTKPELMKAITEIYNGNEYFSREVSDIIMKSHVKKAKEKDKKKDLGKLLTDREMEILKLFAEGNTNHEIADKLFISVRTVESHKTHIMQKLDLKSTVELIKLAIKNNIISL